MKTVFLISGPFSHEETHVKGNNISLSRSFKLKNCSSNSKRRPMCECLNVLTLNSFNVMMGLFTYGVRGGTNLELSARCKFSSNLVNIIYSRM